MKRFTEVERFKYILIFLRDLSYIYPKKELKINQEEFSDFITLPQLDVAIRVLESNGAVEIVGFNKSSALTGIYEVKLTDKFADSFKDFATKMTLEDVELKVEFDGNTISLYETVISTPRAAGENSEVFNILYKHPNEFFTKAKLEKALFTKISKPFSKIVEDLNFIGLLRDVFFNVSKDQIMFKNPVKVPFRTAIDIDRLRYK